MCGVLGGIALPSWSRRRSKMKGKKTKMSKRSSKLARITLSNELSQLICGKLHPARNSSFIKILNFDWGGSLEERWVIALSLMIIYNNVLTIKICLYFDGASLKVMLTWHTNYLENKNTALHFKKVADPCYRVWNYTFRNLSNRSRHFRSLIYI